MRMVSEFVEEGDGCLEEQLGTVGVVLHHESLEGEPLLAPLQSSGRIPVLPSLGPDREDFRPG